MNTFPLKRTSSKQNFPFPENGQTVYEVPVTFIWVPIEGEKEYVLRLYDSEKNLMETLKSKVGYVSSALCLEEGDYYWTVEASGGAMREMYKFSVSPDALFFDRPTAREVFDSVPDIRPRHLFFEKDIEDIKKNHKTELEVLERNFKTALENPLPERPLYHRKKGVPEYREYFGKFRDFCDRDMVALAQYYGITGNKTAGLRAKEIFLEICDWNPSGPCDQCGGYGDEVGLSIARCFPAVFDLIYDLLDDGQKKYAALSVAAYAKQCKTRIDLVNYAENPSNSHVGRLPGYLGEAALVLKGTGVLPDEVLIDYLSTALDIYCGIFPYYGSADGSWAEGMFYGTSYTKWFLPFFSAVKRYTGKSLMMRPFYHRFSNFLVHFCNPDYEIHPFGDGYWCKPDSEEWPGFFAQNPYRIYAEEFGGKKAKERLRMLSKKTDYYRLHLLDLFLPTDTSYKSPLVKEAENAEVFPDGGFVAIHSDIESKNDICILARASKFGSDSHRHADQGSFAIFCGGTCLVGPSGYFGREYGTAHHQKWTNSTKAHNSLLFNAEGQPINSIDSVGKIVSFDKENKTTVLDISKAYPSTPLKTWTRTLSLKGNVVEITDNVEASSPVEVTYPLHFMSEPKKMGDNGICLERNGYKLTVFPTEGNLILSEITGKYDVDLNEGVPSEVAVEMPKQYHAYFKTKKSMAHVIKMQFNIEK